MPQGLYSNWKEKSVAGRSRLETGMQETKIIAAKKIVVGALLNITPLFSKKLPNGYA
jgi:hypothetical protein